MFIRFRDREALAPARLEPNELVHTVETTEAESSGLRRFGGKFVAVLRTASGNAHGNCVAWIAGFGSIDAARVALAEAMAQRLAVHGRRLSAADVIDLGRRSTGRFVPEWGGPERRFERLSLLLHFGRIYTPLDREAEAADEAAYEAYMAERKAEAEALERAKASEALEHARAAEAIEHARAAEALERAKAAEITEALERARLAEAERQRRREEEAVSHLLWRAYERRLQGCRVAQKPHVRALQNTVQQIRWAGVRYREIFTPDDALDLAYEDWFRRWCMRDAHMRHLRRHLIEEARSLLDAVDGAWEDAEDLLPRIRHAVAFLRAASHNHLTPNPALVRGGHK